MDYVFRKWLFLWKILIWLENVMRVYYCTRLAQLGATFYSSNFPLLWNSGLVMDCVFRKWVFIWKILIWLENVMGIYCCNRRAQLSTTFFKKITIIVKSGVGDGLCISKMIIPLENINLNGKCYEGLLLYSPRTTQHNFIFKNSHFCEIRGRWWTMYLKMSINLENIDLIDKCYKDLLLYSPSTTQHNFIFKNSHFCEIPVRWWSMYFENEYSIVKYKSDWKIKWGLIIVLA